MGVEVIRNDSESRYEIRVDGKAAGFTTFRVRPDALTFPHTEVYDAYEGQGLGTQLIKATLDDVRSRGEQIVPLCPFISAYIRAHQEYRDLIVPRYRERFDQLSAQQ